MFSVISKTVEKCIKVSELYCPVPRDNWRQAYFSVNARGFVIIIPRCENTRLKISALLRESGNEGNSSVAPVGG